MIAIYLSKHQSIYADPRAIYRINFTRNLVQGGNTTMFFILQEAKEIISYFSQEPVRVL